MKHVVFADANNKAGKELLADAYEQMGYQAESGPWRSVYLQGAYELRNGVPSAGGVNTASPDTIKAMQPEMTFDYFAVRLNAEKSAGKKLSLNIEFTDLKQPYSLVVENGVLNYFKKPFAGADAKVTLTKATLDRIQLKEITIEQAITSGELKVEGKREASRILGCSTLPFGSRRDAMKNSASASDHRRLAYSVGGGLSGAPESGWSLSRRSRAPHDGGDCRCASLWLQPGPRKVARPPDRRIRRRLWLIVPELRSF